MAEVQLRGVVKAYGAMQVVHAIDLDISDGEFVVLVHPATISTDDTENLRVLRLLLEEVPLKSAVRLAAAMTGAPRNTLYNSALTMQKTLHAATENTTETD